MSHARWDIQPFNLERKNRNALKMAEETTKTAGDAEFVTVKIEGLKVATNTSGKKYTEELRIRRDRDIADLWTVLKALGYEAPTKIKVDKISYGEYATLPRVPTPDTIEVVQNGQSEVGKCIHVDEPLIAFTNRSLDHDVEVNVNQGGEEMKVELSESTLAMSLHRTTRMPDDDKLHQLPPSLGKFQLHNVSEYADRLPEKITNAGGVFFPMWQREATWIGFSAGGARKFALRVFVGQINAVSGAKMKHGEEKNQDQNDQIQDYAVVPGQPWLDGICVAPGVVRQFVAMPLGSGYTVEGQKTGEEKFGGLQIEVIPSYEECLKRWTTEQLEDKVKENSYFANDYLDEFKTPAELGLAPGSKLKAFIPDPPFSPVNMADLARDISQNNQAIQAEYGLQSSFCKSVGYDASSPVAYSAAGITDNLDDVEEASDGFSEMGFAAPPVSRPEPRKAPKRSNNLRAMGLAAGGKLIQDIYNDDFPAGIWNTGAARILHVHILDPRSFEAVTHVVPQPPPRDAKGSADFEGPYFVVEEKIDDRLDGGDFDNVASVSAMDKKTGIVTEPSLDPSKPTKCRECETRLCDCVVRPCGHLFCNTCIKVLEKDAHDENARRDWKCPTCQAGISHVAGFSAPMNLPGEETVRERIPVRVLKIEDGRLKFKSIQRARV